MPKRESYNKFHLLLTHVARVQKGVRGERGENDKYDRSEAQPCTRIPPSPSPSNASQAGVSLTGRRVESQNGVSVMAADKE